MILSWKWMSIHNMPTLQITWSPKNYLRSRQFKKIYFYCPRWMYTMGWAIFILVLCSSNHSKLCSGREEQGIFMQCHAHTCEGHFSIQMTSLKVRQWGFYWPTLFKYAHGIFKSCDKYQRLKKLTKKHMTPLNPILVVELFDVWELILWGHFHPLLDIIISW